jgi:Nitrogen regulatory protein P-II
VHRVPSGRCGRSALLKKLSPFKNLGNRQRTGTGLEAMKIVMAIIKPFKFDEARDVLIAIEAHGMTAIEAKGYGRQKTTPRFIAVPNTR